MSEQQRKLIVSCTVTLLLGFGIVACIGFYEAKKPLDTEKIKLLAQISQSSNTRIVTVYGTNGREASGGHTTATAFRDVLLTLAPVDKGVRAGVMRFPECQFLFQTRMDPTVIYVREFTPTSLEFEIDGILYTGGDFIEFKRQIEQITGVPFVSRYNAHQDATPEPSRPTAR